MHAQTRSSKQNKTFGVLKGMPAHDACMCSQEGEKEADVAVLQWMVDLEFEPAQANTQEPKDMSVCMSALTSMLMSMLKSALHLVPMHTLMPMHLHVHAYAHGYIHVYAHVNIYACTHVCTHANFMLTFLHPKRMCISMLMSSLRSTPMSDHLV